MRTITVSVTLIALATTVCLALQVTSSSSSQAPAFAIRHVRVFDGERAFDDRTVVIRNGRIASIVAGSDGVDVPAVDGSGSTLLPGLIDAHTHTDEPEQLRQALVFGVTTCLDMATPPATLGVLRAAARDRNDIADFRSAGILATAPGGHGTEVGKYGKDMPTIADASAADAFVEQRKTDGSDYLKIVLNGVRAVRRGMPTLAPPAAKALIDAAHARGILAVAHIESADDVKTVIEHGVHGLVHIWRDHGADAELARMIAARGAFVVPTISVPDSVSGSGAVLAEDPRLRPYLGQTARGRMKTAVPPATAAQIAPTTTFLEALRSLSTNGVKIVAGTDVGAMNVEWRHGVQLHRELELYVRAGLTAAQALQAATANAADAFKLSDRGRIAPGRRADLLLVRGDPTKDITATRDIMRVWKAGVEVTRRPVN